MKGQLADAAAAMATRIKEGAALARDTMKEAIAESEKPVPDMPTASYAVHTVPVSGDDMALEHIRSLHGLLKAGYITEAEFNAKRTELLKRL